MIHSHVRGHATEMQGTFHLTADRWEPGPDAAWVFIDTKEPVDDYRPCARCGRVPTPEGYDACLGYIPGAIAACCGHGVTEPYVLYPS